MEVFYLQPVVHRKQKNLWDDTALLRAIEIQIHQLTHFSTVSVGQEHWKLLY